MIDMAPVKAEVRASRPPADGLREAILAEPDKIDAASFVAKLRTWLVLLRLNSDISSAGGVSTSTGAGRGPRGGDAGHGGGSDL
jgi:hypothetical protein